MANEKNEWGSNISFLLAMIGSAVGLGNIWRFPYVLYSNGGGAFYIPYITAVLILGIPDIILNLLFQRQLEAFQRNGNI